MLDELKIVRQLGAVFPGGSDVLTGIGDDCAAVRAPANPLLVAADQVIERIHFTPETPPEKAGAKLLLRNVSDIAAMGGTPRWAILTLAVNGRDEKYIMDFCRGVAEAGSRYGVTVIGGDTASLPSAGVAATLTILGEAPSGGAITRDGARVGDYLYVTGKIGNSFLSGRHLDIEPRLKEGQYLAQRHLASAMLDVSDGLLLDAARLAAASHVALQIEPEKVPLFPGARAPEAWSEGEDYELIFTSPEKLETLGKTLVPICCWGRCVAGDGELLDKTGKPFQSERLGYEH